MGRPKNDDMHKRGRPSTKATSLVIPTCTSTTTEPTTSNTYEHKTNTQFESLHSGKLALTQELLGHRIKQVDALILKFRESSKFVINLQEKLTQSIFKLATPSNAMPACLNKTVACK